MAAPLSFVEGTVLDFDRELSHWRFAIATITATNFATQNAAITALYTALYNLLIGVQAKQRVILTQNTLSKVPPTSQYAQREAKWLVQYHDANGKSFKGELACPDLTLLLPNSEKINHADTGGKYTAFKTAFEALVVSPDDISACVLDEISQVGRNL